MTKGLTHTEIPPHAIAERLRRSGRRSVAQKFLALHYEVEICRAILKAVKADIVAAQLDDILRLRNRTPKRTVDLITETLEQGAKEASNIARQILKA